MYVVIPIAYLPNNENLLRFETNASIYADIFAAAIACLHFETMILDQIG